MGAAKKSASQRMRERFHGGTAQEAAQRLFDKGLHPAQRVLERELDEKEEAESDGPSDAELDYMFGPDSRGES